MGNPILGQMFRSNPIFQGLSQLFGLARSMNNPMSALQQLSGNDQRMGQVNGAIQQFGNGNPETAFYNMARQRGVDPQSVLSQAQEIVRNMGYKV